MKEEEVTATQGTKLKCKETHTNVDTKGDNKHNTKTKRGNSNSDPHTKDQTQAICKERAAQSSRLLLRE